MRSRVVALVDMDCFYVQVEERLNPEYKGKPAAVVQYNTWKGGGIIAVNYEARDRGVTRFMRGDEAKEKCPDIILVRVNEVRGKAELTKYRDAGNEVLEVMCKFSNCVQRASVDEAYLDLSEEVDKRLAEEKYPGELLTSISLPNTYVVGYSVDGRNDEEARAEGTKKWLKSLWDPESDSLSVRLAVGAKIVEEMRAAIFETTGFKCSAGISANKVLSKLSCGLHKPNRQTVLPHSSVPELFSRLPVHKVRSLGGKFGTSLVEELGCKFMGDLTRFTESELKLRFDEKTGSWLYNLARGIDNDPVVPRLISKSIGCCKKFPGPKALAKKEDVERWMLELASEMGERLSRDMAENKRRARLLTVHVQLDTPSDSSSVSSSLSRSGPLSSYEPAKISADAIRLIIKTNTSSPSSDLWTPPLKFLGLSAGKFVDEDLGQTSSIQKFFSDAKANGEGTSKFNSVSRQTEKNGTVDENVSVAPSTSSKAIEGTSKGSGINTIDSYINGKLNSSKNSESNDDDDSLLLGSPQECPRCSSFVPVALLPEHLDHHLAMDLHAELNSNRSEPGPPRESAPPAEESRSTEVQAQVKIRNKRGRGRGASNKVERTAKVRKIVDFFAPK
ncbi:DNA polymerase eta-like [Ischnura elegans]|uniref:DNA polymerase eta-like n=1 Tax=Ischnura elegans TaxID=197161 RepID=UPI001ED88F85|nr:DNA polymerase eta-like [Ischnura elegans]